MLRWLRTLSFLLIALILVALIVANRHSTTVHFAPLPYDLEMPLYLIFFAGIFLGLFIAGIVTSLKRMGGALERQRLKRQARELSQEKTVLQDALDESLKQETAPSHETDATAQSQPRIAQQ